MCFFTFQRTRLLDNTERLERTGNHLEEGYKICVETGEYIYCHRHLFMSTILLGKELQLFSVVKCGLVQSQGNPDLMDLVESNGEFQEKRKRLMLSLLLV